MRRSSWIAGALCVVTGAGAWAESHRLQEDFTFRRIGVPSSNDGNRITVQIAPGGPSGPSAPPAAGTGGSTPSAPGAPAIAGLAPAPNGVEWFWEAVPPGIDQSSSASIIAAENALLNAPDGQGVPAPRLSGMVELADRYGVEVLTATIGKDVSPALVLAVISVESAGKPDAVSSAGAQGLMQLMPATAERFGVSDSFDPRQNIQGGVEYLDWLMDTFDNDVLMALAGYNAGEGAVMNNNGVPPYAETRAYVPKVIAAWQVAKGLCMTPPELPTDGCVFQISAN